MEGNLRDTPLASVLQLLHRARQTGRLVVDADVPLVLVADAGEITAGGLYDWRGLDAVHAFDLHAPDGSFRFEAGTPGPTLWSRPFGAFLTEWARHNDEWARIRALVDSPSRVLEAAADAGGELAAFAGGRSVRAAAKAAGRSVFETAGLAWAGVRSGALRPTGRYAWHALRVSRPAPSGAPDGGSAGIAARLDGRRNLGELIADGVAPDDLRAHLAGALRRGELAVAGRGWLLRDLTWELAARA